MTKKGEGALLRSRNLDDQTYAQIVEAAEGRLPWLCPEWTDHNAHDPGITVLELLAWYKELQQYHMQSFAAYRRRTDDLNRHLRGQELPLYLAKLELIHSSGGVFVGGVTNLPFEQALAPETLPQNEKSGDFKVTTSVRSLEYWQKPDVKAVYQPSSGGLHLDFGIPSPEQYDYSVAHGVVDIAVPGGIYVNSRVFSQEIPHGLGTGAVDVRVAVEFPDGDDLAMLCGNSEVFKSKNSGVTPPWVEVAAVVYPQKGTMEKNPGGEVSLDCGQS